MNEEALAKDDCPVDWTPICRRRFHVTLHGPFAELEIGGRSIALNHYPDIARRVAQSQVHDAVFSGHDHRKYAESFGNTLWANPGEIMGRFGEPSFAIYDTVTGGFEHVGVG